MNLFRYVFLVYAISANLDIVQIEQEYLKSLLENNWLTAGEQLAVPTEHPSINHSIFPNKKLVSLIQNPIKGACWVLFAAKNRNEALVYDLFLAGANVVQVYKLAYYFNPRLAPFWSNVICYGNDENLLAFREALNELGAAMILEELSIEDLRFIEHILSLLPQ